MPIIEEGIPVIGRVLLMAVGLEIGCFGGWVTRDRGASAGRVVVADDMGMEGAEAGLDDSEEERGFACAPFLNVETCGPLPRVDTGGRRDILGAGRGGTDVVGLSTFLLAGRSVTVTPVGRPFELDDDRLLDVDTAR